MMLHQIAIATNNWIRRGLIDWQDEASVLLGKSTGGGLGCNTNSVIKTLNRLNQARSRLGRWNAYSDHAQVHAKIQAEQALMNGVIDNTAILKLDEFSGVFQDSIRLYTRGSMSWVDTF